jgi:hypothetical protein
MAGGGMMSRAMESQAPAQGGAQYSAPQTANPYQSAFNSQQAPQQMQQRAMSPLMQQQMMRQQQPMFNPMQQQMMRQQQPMFNPMQQQFRPQQQFQQQQQMLRQQPFQQQQMGGLQAALMQMLGQYNQPMQRQQFMPQYQNRALQYRPDTTQAQESLSRVAPSVQEQQRRAAEEAARLQAEQAANSDDADFQAWQRQQYEASKYGAGGG